ncbi:hypothetical protein N9Y42_05385 [Mariniblastus sp.]|nr:hypothetical protein [Mariniblastus sp.]
MKLRIAFLLAATFLVCGGTGCSDGPQNEQVVLPPAVKRESKKDEPNLQGKEERNKGR